MQVTREYLLELDKKRTKIEEEIISLTNFLNSEGMPGVDGKLVDNQGFPIPNVDIMAVRTARNKLIMLQNDLKGVMSTLEESIQSFFKNERENKIKIDTKKEVDVREPITVSVLDDQPKQKSVLKLPFAWVAAMAENSPADEAGLKQGDGIVVFDNSLYYGLTNNPLQKIAEIVGKKIGIEIPVEVLRRRIIKHNEVLEEEINEYINLSLIPHQWAGQGVLGCKLNLTEK